MKVFILTVAFCCAVAFGASTGDFKLPEGIKTCVENDPNLNECLKETIQEQIPKMHKGSPVLRIPPIDPFLVEKVRFDFSNGFVQGSMVLKGVKIYGASRAVLQDIDTKILEDGLTAVIKAHVPRIYVEGAYKAEVKFNDVKMSPRGVFNFTMNDITSTHSATGEFYYIDDVKYLNVTSFDVAAVIKNMKFYASDLLPNSQLIAIVLDFINQYWPDLYKVILPETRDTWEPIVLNNANRFFQTVPFETLIRKSDD